MHRTTIAFVGAAFMSVAVLSAQTPTATPSPPSKTSGAASANTVTYTGCLIPGPSADSFILSNATAKGDKAKQKVSLNVVPSSTKVKVADRMTNAVEVVGTVTPATQKGDAPTLTVTKISWKGDYCG
jgi:hypothetical protein